jgi:hypothetical protein
MPTQLEPVSIPEALLYLWFWFCELSNSRQYSEFGAMPLSYSEIFAWSQLTGNDPTALEVSILKQLDRAYLTESMKK